MLEVIDTRQGTNNDRNFSNGNTLPYTGVPFGMNHYAVQTANEDSWFFNPYHRVFQGIRLSHQPSPWMGDFCPIVITPIAGNDCSNDILSYQSSYRPEESVFSPHYLKVKQLRYNIITELTPSERGCRMKVTYRSEKQAGIVFHVPGKNSWLRLEPTTSTVSGFVNYAAGSHDPEFGMYFTIHFDQVVDAEVSGLFETEEGKQLIVYFEGAAHQTVQASLATSFISQEQAQLNHNREIADSFEAQKLAAEKMWNKYLGKITVSHKNQEYVKTFYTCLYRMFLFPQKFYELNEAELPIHYDTTAKAVKPGYLYTNNGFWDTYKTVYPLYSIIAPGEYQEILAGILTSYNESGFLPKWLSPDERGMMPGTLVDAVIADAAVKGLLSKAEIAEFLEAMVKTATVTSGNSVYGRLGIVEYDQLGYVSTLVPESVNQTLDYAYSDFCISQTAALLENQQETAEQFKRSSLNYRNLFDSETGFMRGKDSKGIFRADFSAERWGFDYTEGSAWQNSFGVYHNFQDLIDSYESETAFLNRLTELCNTSPSFEVGSYGFEIHEMSEVAAIDYGQLALSNQPSFHIPYLFNYVGKPASAQVVVKQLMTRLFNSGFEGFPGDEDNGSMSGWFVFSSMGFYPVTPGSGEYVLGIPLFEEVSIQLPNGKMWEIETLNNTPQANFVTKVEKNQQDYKKLFLTHDDLVKGGEFTVYLGVAPVYQDYSKAERPFSLKNQ
ncbi:GH92 family glycosyl hydrolase [Carnobacterium mobile]|uniref:GH92 family glycosyl hydrolase n=1 Tax=Carnobacterium mobile TaxID=2750 RepID=UPI001867C78F|nr:GH92 family glycosyl hydrolase [Carnobacterium mobile]